MYLFIEINEVVHKNLSGGHGRGGNPNKCQLLLFLVLLFLWLLVCIFIVKNVPGLEAESLSSIPNYTTYSARDLVQGTIRKRVN